MSRKVFETGIYEISNEEYHASAGLSRSAIMEFKKTPLHYWHKYLNPAYQSKESSNEMIFGSAFHSYVLEPDTFDKYYFIASKNPYHGNSKEGRAFKEDMKALSRDKIILDRDDFEEIKLMTDAFMKDDYARELIKDAEYEKSMYWIDPDTGLQCKCRPDILHSNFVVDIKTTREASPRKFQSDFHSFGYHMQMAMIHEGIKHTQEKIVTNFIALAIEKTPPYCHAIYPLDPSVLLHGVREFKYYLFKIKECIEIGLWPSYETQVISLPNYATIGE